MSDLRLLSLSVLFILLMVPAAARFPMAKPGCNDTCGNGVTIPYPFGIGPDCALNQSFTIYCNGSSPYLSFPKNSMSVMEVSLSAQTIILNYSVPQLCLNRGLAFFFDNLIARSPFYYSGERNKLMLLGCGNVRLQPYLGTRVLSGCTSICEFNSSIKGCYGTNCCEANIPFYLTTYLLEFKSIEVNTTGYDCSSAFLVDQKWKPENYSDLLVPRSELYIRVVLSWILQSQSDVDAISGCKPKMIYIPVNYTSSVTTYQCECDIFGNGTWFFGINPYLDGACNYG